MATKKAPVELAVTDETRVIELHDDYSGRPSKEKIIKRGLYLENDPRLMGIADYLISQGFADEVELDSAAKMQLALAAAKPPAPVKERDGLRGHIEPTQLDSGMAIADGLPPPETEPLPRNPARRRVQG